MLGMSTITVTPRTGTWTSGNYVATNGATFTALASVQSPSAEQLEMLPEGARATCEKVAYVRERLDIKIASPGASGHPGDLVSHGGKSYVVVGIRDRSEHTTGLPHLELMLTRVGADE